MVDTDIKKNNNSVSVNILKGHKFKLSPGSLIKYLVLIIFILFVAHLLSLYISYLFPGDSRLPKLLDRYFNLNNEGNFPTFFSSLILLIASGLLFYIYKITAYESSQKNNKYWLFLSCVFLFLCFDEATLIHDELVMTIRKRVPNISGFLYYSWVIPYAILTLAFVAYSMRFVLALPKKTRNLFFISGFIYVFAALGFELFEGNLDKTSGVDNLLYVVLTTIEELLEMVGIVVFIYALLDYIAPYKAKFMITPQVKSTNKYSHQ